MSSARMSAAYCGSERCQPNRWNERPLSHATGFVVRLLTSAATAAPVTLVFLIVGQIEARLALAFGPGSNHVTRRPGCIDFSARRRGVHDNPLERGPGSGADF